ncbi:MAG: hypothetical protein WKG01_39415 [Kofleriaceae bacterium]
MSNPIAVEDDRTRKVPLQAASIEDPGLAEAWFGEYLVDQGVVDRFQLFQALQLQDRSRGVRLGEAITTLGYAPAGAIEHQFARFQQRDA